ncbi:MAG: V-type proton ATPase subunit E [Treponema sp.]|nr:V-type proton ATPase subunit E [Treponema sp.]
MQELRSTEIIDKEIRQDARLKAEALLKRADEECASILAGVEKRLQMARIEKQEFYDKKLTALQKDLDASGPLEKQRMQVSFIQKELITAVNKYLSQLSQEKRLELVLNSCALDSKALEGKTFNIFVYGFDVEKAKTAVLNRFKLQVASVQKTEFGRFLMEEEMGLDVNEGIILEAEDKSMRLRLTLTEVFTRIMDKNRAELTKALFTDSALAGGTK